VWSTLDKHTSLAAVARISSFPRATGFTQASSRGRARIHEGISSSRVRRSACGCNHALMRAGCVCRAHTHLQQSEPSCTLAMQRLVNLSALGQSVEVSPTSRDSPGLPRGLGCTNAGVVTPPTRFLRPSWNVACRPRGNASGPCTCSEAGAAVHSTHAARCVVYGPGGCLRTVLCH
jgi:hypothetical protein